MEWLFERKAMAARKTPHKTKNRFERHPVVTLVGLICVLMLGLLFVTEWMMTPGQRVVAANGGTSAISPIRFLAMREWRPNTTYTYRAPEARYNDAVGPVDDEYTLEIDANGFIAPSIRHASPDMEIAFLGGSTTECLYVRPEKRFPVLVGDILEDRTKLKINAINAGKSGNHTMHSLLNMIGKVVPRRPRYVVLMNATNDVGWLSGHGTYWFDKKGIGLVQHRDQGTTQILRDVRERTFPRTFRKLGDGFQNLKRQIKIAWAKATRGESKTEGQDEAAPVQPSAAQPSPPTKDDLRRREQLRRHYEPALRSFVRVAKAWDIEPVLMTQILVEREEAAGAGVQGDFLAPEQLRQGNFDQASFSSIHAYANALIRHVAATEDAMLIDLAAAREWGTDDVYDGLHLTTLGSERAAQTIADALQADMKTAMAAGQGDAAAGSD